MEWADLCVLCFRGIEVMGLMAVHLKDPKDAAKSGRVMLIILAVIYIVSIGLALLLVPVTAFNENSSPFITSLEPFHLSIFLHIFNGIFIIAGFSTLVASSMRSRRCLARCRNITMHLLVLNKRTISCQMVFDFVNCCWIDCLDFAGTLLSKHIYEHLTTAAGLTLLYTWVFILLSSKSCQNHLLVKRVKRFLPCS